MLFRSSQWIGDLSITGTISVPRISKVLIALIILLSIIGHINAMVCPNNCLECTSSTECSKCKEQYFIDALKQCDPCQTGCSTCTSFHTCDTCLPGYSLMFGNCERCLDDHCEICDSDRVVCKRCSRGFTVNSDRGCSYRWHVYFGVSLLVAVAVTVLWVGLCCSKNIQDDEDDEGYNEHEDYKNAINKRENEGYDNIISPAMQKKTPGYIVSIMQNIGAEGSREQSEMDDNQETEKYSPFFGSAPNPFQSVITRTNTLINQTKKTWEEPSFPASKP